MWIVLDQRSFVKTKSDLHICLGLKKMPKLSHDSTLTRTETSLITLLGDLMPHPSCVLLLKGYDRWPNLLSPCNFLPLLFMLSFYWGGLRLKTWDHAPSHPQLPLVNLLHSWFCWIFVSCEPFSLRNTHWQNPKLSAAPLPHTHDLNVIGGKDGLLGVEGKEGAVRLSAIRPFTNHHWPPCGAPAWQGITGVDWEWEGAFLAPPSHSSSRAGLSLQHPRALIVQPVHCVEISNY